MGTARIHIAAPPDRVYQLVTDITRTGEWSPENQGGEWLDGATGAAVGARFKSRNKRKSPWTTTCTVTAADPGGQFAFDVGKGETRWAYDLASDGDGTLVTESFEIVKAPGLVGRLLTKMGTGVPWSEREADLVRGMEQTLAALKATAETP